MAFTESFLGRKGKNRYNILTQFSGKMLQDTLTIHLIRRTALRNSTHVTRRNVACSKLALKRTGM